MADFTEQRFDYSNGKDSPELIIMVGVSGSGKSVHAKALINRGQGKVVRLNRDSIRVMLYNDVPWNSKNENLVRDLEKEAARMALRMGKSVIIDDTNCVRQTRYSWEKFAIEQRVKLRIVTMTTDLKTCIERDAARLGKENVGEKVIRGQHKQLNDFQVSNRNRSSCQSGSLPVEMKLTRPYFERQLLKNGGFLPRLPGCPWVLVDVDGTLCDATDVRGPFEENKVLEDKPYEVVCEWVRALYPTHNVCIVSGRHDWCGDDTCDWMGLYDVPFDHILMRATGDNRPDWIVKTEILNELAAVIGKENIAFVLDDRPQVIAKCWRANGIKVYPVRGAVEDF